MEGENSNDDNGNQMVNYIKVQNKTTCEVTTYITGNAEEGATTFEVGGLNGGAGVSFRSEDEAAFAWSLENAQFTANGSKEHAATIYSEQEANGKGY